MNRTEAILKLIEISEKDIEAGNLIEQDKVFAKIEKENPWLIKQFSTNWSADIEMKYTNILFGSKKY